MTPPNDRKAVEDARERLAAIEHERWASWQNYLHSFLIWNRELEAWVLPHEWKDRWQMQVNTPYSMLSEKEQASDMEQVDRYWPIILDLISAAREEGKREGALGIELPDGTKGDKRLMLRDITRPEIGAHILKAALKETKQ
jgi:hypothetical protein